MCEILIAAWPAPRPFHEIEGPALELERLGVAGFGWGVATVDERARLLHKSTDSMWDDYHGRNSIREISSRTFLIHLRRPSRLSTRTLEDTQPFVEPEQGFAFSHNGLLARHEEFRRQFASRLVGAGDSEIAFQLFGHLLSDHDQAVALTEVHRKMEGEANFAILSEDGAPLVFGGHRDNPFWVFRRGDGCYATTGLHSGDESVFDLIFPGATDRKRVGATSIEVAP